MFILRLILAAGSFSTLISGAPVPSSLSHTLTRARAPFIPSSIEERTANTYTVYGGTGEPDEGWPALSDWQTFDTMFSNNEAVMLAGCGQFGVPENTASEIADIKSAISSVASSTNIDSRFILAIVLQESNGCVRAPTTNYGVRNPGLMQSHNGAGTCNDATVQTPCPQSEITQMITDGTTGTASGDGLQQCLAESGATDVSMFYKAARIYNSGSIDSTKNLGAGIATHCYASDIANRLTGWFSGVSSCQPGSIAQFNGVVTAVTGGGSAASSPVAAAPPATTSAAGGVFAAIPTPTPTPATPAPVAPAPVAPIASAAPAPVAPAPVAPAPVAPAPAPAAPVSTPAVVAPVRGSNNSGSTASGAITAGTACTTEGYWNCVDGSSFQQCASGTWSAIQSLAAGTQCVVGQSAVISVSAIAR